MAEDGSVIIKVSFETGDVDRGVENIAAGCRRAGAAVSQIGRNASRLRMGRPMREASRAVGALAGEMDGLARREDSPGGTRFARSIDAVGRSGTEAADGLGTAGAALGAVGLAAADGMTGLLRYGAAMQTLAVLGTAFGKTLRDGMVSLARYDKQARSALSSLQGSLSSVKSSLVTAFAPVATAVAPAVSRLCSMLATAANYVAMFFAVLGGRSTYRRASSGASSAAAGISAVGKAAGYAATSVSALGGAVKVASVSTDAFGIRTAAAINGVDQAAVTAAGGIRTIGRAVRDAERNLAGLDELNIWKVKEEEPSGSGGGGAGGGGGYGGGGGLDIQDGGGFTFEEVPIDPAFAEKMDWLKEHLDGILTAAGAIGAAVLAWKISRAFGASLKTALGLAVAVGGAVVAVRGYLDAWKNGIDLTNLKETFGGLALIIGGVGVAAGPAAAAVAALAGGVGTAMLALREWNKTGKLTRDGLTALTGGILLVGGAVSMLTGSWIPLAVAAAAAVATAVAARWSDIRAWTIRTWTDVKTQIVTRWEEIRRAVSEKATSVWSAVRAAFENIRATMSDKTLSAWQKVTAVFEKIKDTVRDKMELVKDKVRAAVKAIQKMFDFQWELPHIKLPHFTISGAFSLMPPSIPTVSVSWYARGGIVDGATLIGAGEAGREAIVPLERHTEWIESLAERLAERLGQRALAAGLGEIAQRLGQLPAALDRLGLAVRAGRQPVMAEGTVIPPRALYVDGPVRGLAGSGYRRAMPSGNTAGQGRDERPVQYTFVGQIDRRVLFQEVLDEAAARQSQSGRNPFEL